MIDIRKIKYYIEHYKNYFIFTLILIYMFLNRKWIYKILNNKIINEYKYKKYLKNNYFGIYSRLYLTI